MGTLFIRELPVECIIGIHPFERASRQTLLISLTAEADFTAAAASDDISEAIDYVALASHMETITREGEFALIETLAERLANDLFQPPMVKLEIEVQKPRALHQTPLVGVRATRSADSDPNAS